MQAEAGGPTASRRNRRIVKLGTLAVGWGAARFGKNLVRQLAVPARCGCNRYPEGRRCKWLAEKRLKRHRNISPTPRSRQTLRT